VAADGQTTVTLPYEIFEQVDMRVGEIVEVQDFPRARNPSYRLRIYFGEELGFRWSSAQVTAYSRDELVGMQCVAVVNFAPKNIAGFLSECLVMGAVMEDGMVSILSPNRPAVVGARVF
jgi:tRNA-binding protein